MNSASPPKFKIAIIGAGLIGPRHAKTVLNSDVANLIAIVDPMPHGETLATELGTHYYCTIADLLVSPHKPDAAIICTPNHTHVPVANELASAGVHILIEKPFSTDIPSGKELLEHIQKSGVKALVGHHRRFNPYMTITKEIVASGSLGRIIAVSGLWTTYKPADYFDPPTDWRQHETGGVVLINLIHEVDLLHYLFGPIVRVHAEKAISTRGFQADEGAAIVFKFKSGVVGTFIVADNVPSPYNFEAGTGENPLIPMVGQDFYRVFGTDATLSVPDMTRWSYDGWEKKSWLQEFTKEKISVQPGVPFERQLIHFVRVIRGETEPSCTPQSGLAALVVCEAVKEAIKTNRSVEIEDIW
jgi:predicted dehydrogenase